MSALAENKLAVVTGGSSRIGRTSAKMLWCNHLELLYLEGVRCIAGVTGRIEQES